MKKIIFLLWAITTHTIWAQTPDPNFNDKVALMETKSHIKSAAFVEAPDNASFDLIYQSLNLKVDPAVNYIAGTVVSRFIFLKENVNEVHFDLSYRLTVDSVYFEGKKIAFEHKASKIKITMPQPSLSTPYHEIIVYYKGAPPLNDYFFTYRHNNIPVMFTVSEPYGARDWFPCKESLSDKIDSIDIIVTNPSQYRVASNGKLMSDEVSGDLRTAHWRHRYPIATYLVAFALTNYNIYSDFVDAPDGKKIEILNYIFPEYLITAKTKSEEITYVMDFFNRKLITYPFADEKYGHAQYYFWNNAMEHQTMSFMGNLSFDMMAHEMAHQWFGDYITLGSWKDIWLNEGFATYMNGLVYETLEGGKQWPVWKKQQLASITSQPGGTVYVPDTTNFSHLFDPRLSYAKGAYLLHMLRWEMGDDIFFKALKNYLTDSTIANGFAKQEDLVRHMEQAADTTFTEFFNDWYYGQGYPTYKIKQSTVPGSNGAQMIEVSQTPSHPSVSFFEMHLPIRVWKNGKSTDLRLFNNEQNQQFTISETAVDSIEFDPNKWLITKAAQFTDTKEIAIAKPVKIIHDPISQRVRVVLPDYEGKNQVRIIEMSGKTVMQTILKERDTYIDINDLQNGIYIIEVTSGIQTSQEKVIISN